MPFRETNHGKVWGFVSGHNDTYDAISPSHADMSGKSILITGASRGIGKATAIRFAMAGCSKIAVAARTPLEDVRKEVLAAAAKAGHTEPLVITFAMDVTSEDSVREAASTVRKQFDGQLDIFVSNAGYLERWDPVVDSEAEEWWKTWEVNIKGTYLCAKYFVPLLLQSQTKLFIGVSSAGANVVRPGASSYQSTKFAVCRFVEFLDQEYNDEGLVAIAIHPGGVKTDLAMNMPEDMYVVLTDTAELGADTMIWLGKERREWLAGRYVDVHWDVNQLAARSEEIEAKDLLKFRLQV